MNELLVGIIETHGGMDRWNSFDKVEVTEKKAAAYSASKVDRRIQHHVE
jgi:hypothetical protein